MNTIIITGWNPGLDKIALTKKIRKHTGLGLAEGKQCTDQILDKKPVRFKKLSKNAAEVFLMEVRGIGAIGEIKEENT
jgi:ribosomal protein L7/L12